MLLRRKFLKTVSATAVALSLGLGAAHASANEITGAGSTAVFPVLAKWAEAYKAKTGVAVNYQSIGSGGGINQIKKKTVLFGDSDMPLTPEELQAASLVQFPVVIIGIAPIVNVPGVKAGDMVLDGQVLADIYLGKITKWNDPAIKRLNPRLNLPAMAITTVHRSDGSGTTFYFTNYLSKVSPEWKEKIGSNTAVNWSGGMGGKGSEGVSSFVKQIPGAIGYVEYAYAKQSSLAWTKMLNKDGKVVVPTASTFQAASAHTDFAKAHDFYVIMTDQPGATSWPLTATTYFLLRRDTPKAENAEVVNFAKWFLNNGQAQANALDYVPLPAKTVQQIEHYWKTELGL